MATSSTQNILFPPFACYRVETFEFVFAIKLKHLNYAIHNDTETKNNKNFTYKQNKIHVISKKPVLTSTKNLYLYNGKILQI